MFNSLNAIVLKFAKSNTDQFYEFLKSDEVYKDKFTNTADLTRALEEKLGVDLYIPMVEFFLNQNENTKTALHKLFTMHEYKDLKNPINPQIDIYNHIISDINKDPVLRESRLEKNITDVYYMLFRENLKT